ncbi:MAG TPA: SH3 domain-containing protein [Anaerolineales bacterium]|nr:SH3 domain-containing protein [Anaerolineales bacterium]
MLKLKLITLVTILTLLATACLPLTTPTPPPILTEEPGIPVTGIAFVQSVEVQILESQPLQVNVIARGQLPDGGCTTISAVDQVRAGNTFNISLTTTTDPLAICTLAATPFEQVIPLDVNNLPPAEYSVNVNGVTASFELLTRDISNFRQLLVQALNVRDYNLLKVLMDDSFMIGYWESEGTSQTPDLAVEQLQRSLLSASSLITADENKNLVELLGTDPITIVDPEVQEVSPLFTSGWGPQGKDEAILFAARLPDGGLYWYGLLFAKDGFARPDPVVVPPVDTNAYSTNVKFVMALQDVRMRSGPGTQFSIISFLAEGQTAQVTGVSADENWWRVICPDNSIGSCWISAARHLTRPTEGIVTPPPANPVGTADVQSIEIQILESFPIQVNVIARGQLPDAGCTTIAGASQTRTGNTFNVTVTTKTDPKALCAQMLTPFEYVISLDVSSLLPGPYIVNVNGVQASFELPESVPPTDNP